MKRSAEVNSVKPITFLLDTWFLKELVRTLTPSPDEEMVYLTGPKTGNLWVVSRVLPLEYEHSSIAGVRTTKASSVLQLVKMLRHGNLLHIVAHSHPGRGARGTTPSDIDRDYMTGLQIQAGAKAVGLIVTRDGFLRFFSVSSHPFKVLITGLGITPVPQYKNVYHLDMSAVGADESDKAKRQTLSVIRPS